MSAWIAKNTLRTSLSNDADAFGESVKRPNRSHSLQHSVPLSRALLAVTRRRNSHVPLRAVQSGECWKPRYQCRSYLNSPVKRAQYFADNPENALQGSLSRPEGAARDRL